MRRRSLSFETAAVCVVCPSSAESFVDYNKNYFLSGNRVRCVFPLGFRIAAKVDSKLWDGAGACVKSCAMPSRASISGVHPVVCLDDGGALAIAEARRCCSPIGWRLRQEVYLILRRGGLC